VNKSRLLITLIAVGLAQAVHAGFVDESANNPFVQNPQLRIVGNGQQFEDLPGFAADVPLHDAISQIVPRSYTVRSSGIESVDATLVSWQGRRPWTQVLKDVLAQVPGLRAEIDSATKLITFSLMTPAASGAIAEAPSAAMPPEAMWELRTSDQTIRKAFERWSRVAGWQLVWELGVDYPVEATAALSMNFEGAIEAVTNAMQGGEVPPKAIFYRGNRVLRMVARGQE